MSSSIDSAQFTKNLGGKWHGSYGVAPCPVCQPQKRKDQSALTINARGALLLLHCKKSDCAFLDILAAAGLRSTDYRAQDAAILAKREGERRKEAQRKAAQAKRLWQGPDPKQAERSAIALSIWESTIPADGTPVEVYLASRGLTCSLPPSLRFHSGLKHPSGGNLLCMVALVTRGADDMPLAIHRTFLAREGRSKAPVEPAKMMLGPCRGGAVRLGDPGEVLMIGEGIETCLAAMQATGNPAWAALSTSGLRGLDLPNCVSDVIVLADGDDPGEAAARDCALRWMREGRRVRIARPPRGLDFNDVLLGHAPGIQEGAQ